MKKSRLLFIAAAILFAACSSDEGASGEWNGEIRLTSGLDVQSRATADWTNNVFDSGKEIDVQISEKTTGTATTTYAPLVYTTGDNGSLSLAQGYEQPYYPASGNGVNIYAVYPKGSNGTPFAVAADQSGETNYKASDLMYASVSTERTSDAVALKFGHLLSKVTIELKQGKGVPNLAGATVELIDVLPETTLTASATGSSISEASGDKTDITVIADETASTTTVDKLSGSCIVPPQTLGDNFVKVTLSDGGVLIGKLNEGTPELAGGNEYTYEIKVNLTDLTMTSSIKAWNGEDNSADGTAKMYIGDKFASQAEVGDYYLSDGSLVSGSSTLTDAQKNACIGIVFALANSYDESKYPDDMTLHGYVIALNDANSGNACAWGEYGVEIGNFSSSLGNNSNYDDDIAEQYEWSGYKYTLAIKAAAGNDGLTSSNYPAAYYAMNYGVEAPSGTSKWFLPAAGQLKTAIDGIKDSDSAVGNSYANVNGSSLGYYYWSSSEYSDFPEDIALFVSDGGNVSYDYKGYDDGSSVRPVLAF